MSRLVLFFLMLPLFGACSSKKEEVKQPLTLLNTIFDGRDASMRAQVFDARGSSNESLRVFIAKLDAEALMRLQLIPSQGPRSLREIVEPSTAAVAINGGFYDADKAMGLVFLEGQALMQKTKRGGSGIFLVDREGAHIVHRDDDLKTMAPRFALQSIDRLVNNGRSLVGKNAAPDKDARSALVVNQRGDVLLVALFAVAAIKNKRTLGSKTTIELSAKSSKTGASLAEFAELLLHPHIAARSALNLDGGYSTSFFAHFEESAYEVIAHKATINALKISPLAKP